MLDPNRIFWWRTKWAPAPILLSVNNAGQTSVSATFFFSPTTSITGGVFEVTFPSAFTVGSGTGQTYSGQVVQYSPVTYAGGQDYQITITGLANPSTAGPYGPFALRTRYSANSQQVDVNLAFGSVWIYTTAGTLGAFTVTLAGTTINNVINKSGNTLSFKFTLGVSLWRYDTFIINTDKRWTIGSASCASADYAGKWNNFNGTNTSSPHSLECVVSPQSTTTPVSQNIYIFGLAVDGIDLTATTDNQYVDLRVSSVTTPNAVYVANPYYWTVSTSRFGTTTILETANYNAGPVVIADTITTYSWVPTWGAPTAYAPGTIYFMDLSFTTVNPIPLNGQVSITVSGGVITAEPNWVSGAYPCYIVTYHNSYTPKCVATATTITITALPALSAGTTITVRNVVTLPSTGTASITSITTSDPLNSIDVTPTTIMSSGVITVSSTVTAAAYFSPIFATNVGTSPTFNPTSSTGYAGGSNVQTQSIVFAIQTPTSPVLAASTAGTISCPFASDDGDFTIGAPVSSYGFAFSNSVTTASSGVLPIPASLTVVGASNNPPTLSVTIGSTLGSISFGGAISQGTSSNALTTTQINIQLYGTSTTSFISLPRIATNLATKYECRLFISTTVSSTTTTYSAATRFSITAQTFNTPTFSSPCSWYVNGIPAIFSLQTNVFGVPPASPTSSATYYVEVQFTTASANFASGLKTTAVSSPNLESSLNSAFTTSYPVKTSATTSSFTALHYTSGSTINYVAFTGVTLSTSTATIVTFPIGGFTVGASTPVTATVISYYISSTDPRYKFITHSSGTLTYTYVNDAPTRISAASIISGGTAINGSTVSTALQLGLNGLNSYGTNYVSLYYIYFILGTGWTWPSSGSITSLTTTTFSNTYYFSSPTSAFVYAGALVSVTSGASGFTSSTTTSATVSLNGFALPLGVVASSPITVAIGSGIVGTVTCTGYSNTLTYASTAGSITPVTVSPSSVKTSGPERVNISHTVTFSLPHGIPANGSISMTINSLYVNPNLTPCTYCTASGLSNGSTTNGGVTTSTPIKCVISSKTVTVTQFADFSTTTSATPITIVIYGLVGPWSTSTGNAFVTALTSYTSASSIIDQAGAIALAATSNLVTVTQSVDAGAATWNTAKTYPSTAGTSNADLYLKFSLPHSLPTCGVITISSPLAFLYSSSGTLNNYVFLSTIQYTSVALDSSNNLAITLAQPYTGAGVLELYLDSAVNNPSSTTTTTAGFTIESTWGTVPVDSDTGSVKVSQTFTATSVLTSSITAANIAAGVTFAPTTTGEVATYTFDFKDTVNYAVGDQYWIVFPSQFDYFLGNTWVWFNNEPSSYYIDCSSSQLGTTWCTVNHGTVVVWGSNAITGNTEIVININSVINPAPVTTSLFQIYHVSSTGTYLTVNQNFGTVTPGAYPINNVYVRSLVQTDNRLFQSSQYTWRLYISDTMNTDSQLQVQFPREFDLNKFDTKSSYSCSSTWLDNSGSATIKTQQNWNSASSCSVSGNTVTLPAPTTAVTFSYTSIVTWNIQNVINTQWGQTRSAQNTYTDFDVTDSLLWPIYPYWVSKFTFFVYRSSATNLLYTSRSYPNTNAAYTGFVDGYKPLYVNNYSPQSKTNRIVVYAGTQTTDLYITTSDEASPITTKQITLTPTTNSKTPDGGKLKYTSATSNWILFQGYWQIQFRVAAAIDLIKGLYYINWANNEVKHIGLSDVQYDPPASTLVEVIATRWNQYTFAVAAVPDISIGYTSVPIKVSIANAPHTDATVNISVIESHISVNPTSLTFGPDVNALYFQVSVASNYFVYYSTSHSLYFSITGTDAMLYTITSNLKFTITQATTNVDGNIVSWGLGVATKTIQTSAPSSDQVGVIYYQLSAAGSVVPSFSTLKASVGSLVSTTSTSSSPSTTSTPPSSSSPSSSPPSSTPSSSATLHRQLTHSQQPSPINRSITLTDPATGETWTQFQLRLYKLHLGQVWIGALVMLTTTASNTLTFNWLYAATQYQLSGYLDNLNPSKTPTVHTEFFTTTAIADAQPFTISFTGNVAASFTAKIAQEAANVQEVNPLRLGNGTWNQSTGRMLANLTITSTSFLYTLVPNRFSESPDPSTQVQITGAGLTAFTANLQTDGILNALNSVVYNAVPTRTVPTWAAAPTSAGSTRNSVTVSLRSNTAGQTCCVALTDPAIQPTPEQVMLGLDPANAVVSYTCITTDLTSTTNSVQITNLQAATKYYAYCTAQDNYPLWPTQMSYSTTNTMSYVTITTFSSGTTPVVTSASYFGELFILLAFLLH